MNSVFRSSGLLTCAAFGLLVAGQQATAAVTNANYYALDGSAGSYIFSPPYAPVDTIGGDNFNQSSGTVGGISADTGSPPTGVAGDYVLNGTESFWIFPGQTDSSGHTDPPLTNLQNTNIGIEAWVKLGSLTQTNTTIFESGGAQFGGGLELHAGSNGSGGYVSGIFNRGATVGTYTDNSTSQWLDIALVATTSGTTFYVNGLAEGTTSALPTANTSSFNIGQQGYGGNGFFNGSIAKIRVFTFNAGAFNPATDLYTTTATPEPASLALFGLAGTGLFLLKRRHTAVV